MRNKGTVMFLTGLVGTLALGWFGFPHELYKKINQPLQFSHRVHAGEGAGMACEDCHAFAEDGRFSGIPKIAKCAECHAAPLGTTEDEKILVEQYVTPNCEIPWLVYLRQPDNAYFSHVQHVKLAELKCEQCHGPHGASDKLRPFEVNRLSGYSRDIWGRSISRLRTEAWEGMKMDDCIRCHAKAGKAEGCIDCHK